MSCCLCIINRHGLSSKRLPDENGSATMTLCKAPFAEAAKACSACGALAELEFETEIDDPLLRPSSCDRRQRHGDRPTADFIARGADTGERRERRLHHF